MGSSEWANEWSGPVDAAVWARRDRLETCPTGAGPSELGNSGTAELAGGGLPGDPHCATSPLGHLATSMSGSMSDGSPLDSRPPASASTSDVSPDAPSDAPPAPGSLYAYHAGLFRRPWAVDSLVPIASRVLGDAKLILRVEPDMERRAGGLQGGVPVVLMKDEGARLAAYLEDGTDIIGSVFGGSVFGGGVDGGFAGASGTGLLSIDWFAAMCEVLPSRSMLAGVLWEMAGPDQFGLEELGGMVLPRMAQPEGIEALRRLMLHVERYSGRGEVIRWGEQPTKDLHKVRGLAARMRFSVSRVLHFDGLPAGADPWSAADQRRFVGVLSAAVGYRVDMVPQAKYDLYPERAQELTPQRAAQLGLGGFVVRPLRLWAYGQRPGDLAARVVPDDAVGPGWRLAAE